MKSKNIKFAVLGTGAVLICLFGILTANAVNDTKDKSVINEPDVSYQYVELGERCATAANTYSDQAKSLKNQIDVDNADMQLEIAKTQAMISGSAGSNLEGLNSARAGYQAIYADGGMSKEDYDNKMIQLNQVQTTYGTPSSSIQTQLDGIRQRFADHVKEGEGRVKTMQANASKLQACADSARDHKDFSVSDIGEFNALIDALEQ